MPPVYESLSMWRRATDAAMSNIYGIDTDDAGLDDEWLKNHWSAGETPEEFVEWFGRKYDLISKRDVGIDGWW
jgi:hypothetical protein